MLEATNDLSIIIGTGTGLPLFLLMYPNNPQTSQRRDHHDAAIVLYIRMYLESVNASFLCSRVEKDSEGLVT